MNEYRFYGFYRCLGEGRGFIGVWGAGRRETGRERDVPKLFVSS